MQKMTWFRISLASAIALSAATGALVVGCSSDDPVTPPSGTDSGKPDTSTPTTDSGTDTSVPTTDGGADAAPAATYPKLSLVHAAGNLEAVSFCMGVSATAGGAINFALDSVFPTNPDGGVSTGLPPGAGGPLKLAASSAALIPTFYITPFAITASALAGGKSCKAIIPNVDALKAGVVRLTTIEKGTLKGGKSYIGAVIGCTGDATTGSVAKCGADWTAATGNVKLAIFEADTATAVAAGNTAVQFLHLSPAAESLTVGVPGPDGGVVPFQPYAGGVLPAFAKPAPDAGAADPDAGDGSAPDAGPGTVIPISGATKYAGFPAIQAAPLPNALKDLPGISGAAGAVSWQVRLYTAAGAVGTAPVAARLSSVVAASVGVQVAADGGVSINPPGLDYIQDGKAYTLIAVGDPTVGQPGTGAPNPGANFFRLILLDNNPVTTP